MSGQIKIEVQKLVEKGVLKEITYDESMFLSPIFLRPKKSGGFRLILDLKELNKYMPYKHFKMEMLENALTLLKPNMWMCSIDLKDAYYSVPIHPDHQKYFSFKWESKFYCYTCMPNGWSNAPYIFTKLMKPVFYALRTQGHISSYFIDDSWLMGESKASCLNNYQATEALMKILGLGINYDKSVCDPVQLILHLGFMIDSVLMIVYLTQEKKDHIKSLCAKLYNMNSASIRLVAKVIGTLIATFSGVDYGRLYYRNLESNKIQALKHSKGNFDGSMIVTQDMREDLSWWIDNIDTQVRVIRRTSPDITISTDSSMLGWGCTTESEEFNGLWDIQERTHHINVLEVKAILLSIKSLGDELRNKHIRVMTDSTTAVAYVNNKGGLVSQDCNRLAKEIWQYCIQRDIWISCQHVPGIENTADKPSRRFHNDLEWQLDASTFNTICNILGKPDIDLFASRTNHKLDVYCAWRKDPEASFVDAFTLNWQDFNLSYIFPPFSLMGRCIQKLQGDVAEAIVVAPLWPQQLWFPNLMRSLVRDPLLLPNSLKILSLAHSQEKHPLGRKMRLIACRLSGDDTLCKEFRRNRSRSSLTPGENPQESNTQLTSASGSSFVIDGASIHFIQI